MKRLSLWRALFACSAVLILENCGNGSVSLPTAPNAPVGGSPTSSGQPTASATPSLSPGVTPTPKATSSPSPTATTTASPSATPSPSPTPTNSGGQTQQFPVPPALNQTAPPAPPNTTPPSPSAMDRKAVAFPKLPAGSRRRSDASTSPNPIVRMMTVLGNIDVELDPAAAPKNVANFLSYVTGGAYTNSFIHRSVPGFVIQGGGYTETPSPFTINTIPAQAPVVDEFHTSNVRGTLAMAQSGNDPNSATSQWFFNLADNSSTLDSQNGGSTVIGNVVTTDGLAVMDAIAALQVVQEQSPFNQLPVIDYTNGSTLQADNLVIVSSIASIPSHPSFFDGETSEGNGVNYLAFPNGNDFGYYSFLSNENYIYHDDLGYEYVFDASDGQSGIYFYDFASKHYFYTSPSFPFPYMYDFTLKSVVYYYPATGKAGRYTSNPRSFYDFNAKQVITE